jgi:hypothetical protein
MDDRPQVAQDRSREGRGVLDVGIDAGITSTHAASGRLAATQLNV